MALALKGTWGYVFQKSGRRLDGDVTQSPHCFDHEFMTQLHLQQSNVYQHTWIYNDSMASYLLRQQHNSLYLAVSAAREILRAVGSWSGHGQHSTTQLCLWIVLQLSEDTQQRAWIQSDMAIIFRQANLQCQIDEQLNKLHLSFSFAYCKWRQGPASQSLWHCLPWTLYTSLLSASKTSSQPELL